MGALITPSHVQSCCHTLVATSSARQSTPFQHRFQCKLQISSYLHRSACGRPSNKYATKKRTAVFFSLSDDRQPSAFYTRSSFFSSIRFLSPTIQQTVSPQLSLLICMTQRFAHIFTIAVCQCSLISCFPSAAKQISCECNLGHASLDSESL